MTVMALSTMDTDFEAEFSESVGARKRKLTILDGKYFDEINGSDVDNNVSGLCLLCKPLKRLLRATLPRISFRILEGVMATKLQKSILSMQMK